MESILLLVWISESITEGGGRGLEGSIMVQITSLPSILIGLNIK